MGHSGHARWELDGAPAGEKWHECAAMPTSLHVSPMSWPEGWVLAPGCLRPLTSVPPLLAGGDGGTPVMPTQSQETQRWV